MQSCGSTDSGFSGEFDCAPTHIYSPVLFTLCLFALNLHIKPTTIHMNNFTDSSLSPNLSGHEERCNNGWESDAMSEGRSMTIIRSDPLVYSFSILPAVFILHPVSVWNRDTLLCTGISEHAKQRTRYLDSVFGEDAPPLSVGLFLIWFAGNGCYRWGCGSIHMQICEDQESEKVSKKILGTQSDQRDTERHTSREEVRKGEGRRREIYRW